MLLTSGMIVYSVHYLYIRYVRTAGESFLKKATINSTEYISDATLVQFHLSLCGESIFRIIKMACT